MLILDAIQSRRSIRDYLPRLVPRPIIEAMIADAACAPWTPVSKPEPWVFNVIEGRDRISAYGDRALEYARANRPQVEGYRWADSPEFSVFYNAPVVILISGKKTNPLALEECTRAGQILTLSAHARELGSCWVGSPNLWLGDPIVQAELKVPEGFAPMAAFTLGYPAVIPPPPPLSKPRTTWLGDHGE